HDTEFERWADMVARPGAAPGQDFRKDIVLELYNEAGQLVLAYRLYRCWVSEYQALPGLDANSNAVAIESIRLETEGWEHGPQVAPPGGRGRPTRHGARQNDGRFDGHRRCHLRPEAAAPARPRRHPAGHAGDPPAARQGARRAGRQSGQPVP